MSTKAVVGGVVGGAIGFLVAGPVGAGYGFAIGFGLGSMLSPMESPDTQQAATTLQIQTSQRGMPLPVIFGTRRVPGNLIWYDNFQTHKHKQSGGKGGAAPNTGGTSYTYSASFAFAICCGPIIDILRIWADKDEIDMDREGSDFTIYLGTMDQSVDSHMSGFLDRNSAYRGVAYVVFMDWDLGASPRIPNFTFEVSGIGVNEEQITSETNIQEFGSLQIPNLNGNSDILQFFDGTRLYVQDNASDVGGLISYTTGVYSDSFECVASYHVRSSFSQADSDTLGLKRRNAYGCCPVSSDRVLVANAGGCTLYHCTSNTLADLAYARTSCGTKYGAAMSAKDAAYYNGLYATVNYATAFTGDASLYGGPVTVYKLEAASDPHLDPTGYRLKQYSRSGSWQSNEPKALDFNNNGLLAVLGAQYVMKTYTVTASLLTVVDAINTRSLCGASNVNFMCKWNSDGDRIAVSHTSNNSRSITIFDSELNEKCWLKVTSGGTAIAIDDIEWSPEGNYIYGVAGVNIAQITYDKTTETLSQRALTTTNYSFTSALYCAINSLSTRVIVYGPSNAWIGAFKTKTVLTGSGDVTPPYVTERILTNDFWGAGIDSNYLVSSVFTATKSYCLSNDYIISPVFRESQSILDGLEQMISYHDGYITCIDNKIRHEQLLAEDETVVIDDNSEIAGGELGVAKDSERDSFNRIRIAYTNRNDEYTTSVVQRDAFAEQDYSGLREKNISMMAFTHFNRADKMSQRLLKKWLNRPLNMVMKVGPKMKGKLIPGGIFGLDHTVTGITSMKGRITSISESPEDTLDIEFREEKDFLYDTTLLNPPANPTLSVDEPFNLRGDTMTASLYLLERYIDKLGDPTRIIAGVTSQLSDTAYYGAQIYDSPDGATYDTMKNLGGDATTGIVTDVDTSPGYIKSITVLLNEREQTFTSYSSRDTFTNNNVNLAFWNDRKVRFQTITSQGSLSYLLENILISEPLNATTNVDTSEIIFLTYGNLDYLNYEDLEVTGTRYFKAPTYNYAGVMQNISSVSADTITVGKESLQLKPVANLGVLVNSRPCNYSVVTLPSCDTTITWRKRSRLEGFGRKGYGMAGYGHSLTDDIDGWEVFVNSVSQGVHSETTFTTPTCTGIAVTFGVRQVSDNYQSSDVEEITITRL